MLEITTPPTQPLVAASILSADFGRLADECRDVLQQGVDLLHVDVMDGHFVPNLTMGQDVIRALRRRFPHVYLDVHLMVERPGDYIDAFAAAGASLFCFHAEVCRPLQEAGADAGELIDHIHGAGMDAGLALSPPTPPEALQPHLGGCELVLVMSVHPGRSGQPFIPESLMKARALKPGLGPGVRLEMDGGLNLDTAPAAVAAGVDVLVSASALFGAADRGAAVRGLRNAGTRAR